MTYEPTRVETQSGLDRVRHAEGLVRQLPANHGGRNTWLLNYGQSDEAKALRDKRSIGWDETTKAAPTASTEHNWRLRK